MTQLGSDKYLHPLIYFLMCVCVCVCVHACMCVCVCVCKDWIAQCLFFRMFYFPWSPCLFVSSVLILYQLFCVLTQVCLWAIATWSPLTQSTPATCNGSWITSSMTWAWSSTSPWRQMCLVPLRCTNSSLEDPRWLWLMTIRYVCVYVCMYVCVYVCVCVCTYVVCMCWLSVIDIQ